MLEKKEVRSCFVPGRWLGELKVCLEPQEKPVRAFNPSTVEKETRAVWQVSSNHRGPDSEKVSFSENDVKSARGTYLILISRHTH